MTRSREKTKSRKNSGRFAMLPYNILDSDEFIKLSTKAVKLLIDMLHQYNGHNNGDLSSAWGVMVKRGWKSRDTLGKAQNELENNGWIERTRQGMMGTPKTPNLFALTWLPIDECDGKLDVKPTKVQSNKWKMDCDTRIPCNPNTDTVLTRPENR